MLSASEIGGEQTSYNNVIEIDPTNPSIVWAGDQSNAFRSIDGGNRWTPVSGGTDPDYPLGIHVDHHAIAFDSRPESKIVYIGTDGGLYKSTNTSERWWHWSQSSHGMVITEFYSIASQQALVTMTVGGTQDNGVNLTYGNRAWYNSAGGDGEVNGVSVDAKNSSTIYQTTVSPAREFTTTANPVFYSVGGGSRVVWHTDSGLMPFSPLVADASLAGKALAVGTFPSGGSVLLRTTDGINWARVGSWAPTDAIKVLAIAPSSSFGTYYAGLYVSGADGPPSARFWRYSERGPFLPPPVTVFPAGKEPSGIAVDYTRDNRVFATIGQYENGEVFVTTDGGINWQPLPGSGTGALPSVGIGGVVIDPSDPDVIYIATTRGVFQGTLTLSGSTYRASWQRFNEGIPDGINVRAIWVNAAARILYIGTLGYGAYERDIGRKSCPSTMLVVRDSVLDRGFESPTIFQILSTQFLTQGGVAGFTNPTTPPPSVCTGGNRLIFGFMWLPQFVAPIN